MTTLEQSVHWQTDVERGPDWLFVRLHPTPSHESDAFPVAEYVWDLMRQHFATRLVLELDDLPLMRSSLIGQLVLLHKRIVSQGGLMRLASLSDANQSVLRMMRLEDRFPQFRNRYDAVAGHAVYVDRSPKPR